LRPEAATETRRLAMQARWSVAALGGLVATGLLALAFGVTSSLPESAAEIDRLLGKGGDNAANEIWPTIAELERQWPQFRGMNGGATSRELGFDASTATVLWKTPIPVRGLNSPVVWSNRVFLSGGDAAKREVFCFDAANGALLWRRAIENGAGNPGRQLQVSDPPGWAAPTMATDGRRAFAMFVNGDLAAVNFDGTLAWLKQLGVPKNMYGHSASLGLAPGKLIVQLDQDEEAPGGSRLIAFDCATGRTSWERAKPTHGSWSSPIIVSPAGSREQVITLALPFVMSHALEDGNELWRAELMEGEITPSPIFAGGLVVVVSPNSGLLALRTGGAGDVTKSQVAWKATENLPDVTSPVSDGELVFTVTSYGGVGCFDLKDGKQVWQKDLELEIQSSPVITGKKLWVLGTGGSLVSMAVGREFKELGRAKFEDSFHASPAFADGRMLLRGATNLWCLVEAK
jgi:outer membrane protein assembly factor BamB